MWRRGPRIQVDRSLKVVPGRVEPAQRFFLAPQQELGKITKLAPRGAFERLFQFWRGFLMPFELGENASPPDPSLDVAF